MSSFCTHSPSRKQALQALQGRTSMFATRKSCTANPASLAPSERASKSSEVFPFARGLV